MVYSGEIWAARRHKQHKAPRAYICHAAAKWSEQLLVAKLSATLNVCVMQILAATAQGIQSMLTYKKPARTHEG